LLKGASSYVNFCAGLKLVRPSKCVPDWTCLHWTDLWTGSC